MTVNDPLHGRKAYPGSGKLAVCSLWKGAKSLLACAISNPAPNDARRCDTTVRARGADYLTSTNGRRREARVEYRGHNDEARFSQPSTTSAEPSWDELVVPARQDGRPNLVPEPWNAGETPDTSQAAGGQGLRCRSNQRSGSKRRSPVQAQRLDPDHPIEPGLPRPPPLAGLPPRGRKRRRGPPRAPG